MTDDVVGRQLLVIGLVATLLTAVVLIGVVIATKGFRARRALVRARHLEPYREAMLLVAAGDPDDETVDELRRVPDASWPVVQDAVVRLLAKVKGEPARTLVALLDERDARSRARGDLTSRSSVRRGRAAVLLGRCDDEAAVDDLTRLLQDRDPVVRQSAATALGQLGRPEAATALLGAVRTDGIRSGIPSGVAIDALVGLGHGIEGPLQDALADPDPAVRDVAARVVTERTTISARDDVRDRLLAEQDPDVQVALCRALGRLGDDGDVDRLATAARTGPAARRRAAVEALGAIDVPAAVPVLVDLLTVEDRRTAGAAALALAAMAHPAADRALDDLTDERALAAAAYVLSVRDLRRGRTPISAVPVTTPAGPEPARA